MSVEHKDWTATMITAIVAAIAAAVKWLFNRKKAKEENQDLVEKTRSVKLDNDWKSEDRVKQQLKEALAIIDELQTENKQRRRQAEEQEKKIEDLKRRITLLTIENNSRR